MDGPKKYTRAEFVEQLVWRTRLKKVPSSLALSYLALACCCVTTLPVNRMLVHTLQHLHAVAAVGSGDVEVGEEQPLLDGLECGGKTNGIGLQRVDIQVR